MNTFEKIAHIAMVNTLEKIAKPSEESEGAYLGNQ